MNPEEQSQLILSMAEKILIEMQGMRQEQVETNKRLDRLEKRTEQNTAAIGQLQVSVLKIDDKLDELVDLSKRVRRLEDKIFS